LTFTKTATDRVGYIDWLRGLAALGMFEVHCYDAWLGGSARESSFFHYTQLSGTVPAPLFVFLSGISFALITDRMRRKGATPNQLAVRTLRRGAEILGLALLFRVQEFVLGQPWAPVTDLARVDVLNLIGVTIIAMAVLCWLVRGSVANALAAAGVAAAIAVATPPMWTTWAPKWVPWFLESYLNGVHNLGVPQPWLFSFFPWAAFAFAGLAVGFYLFSDWASQRTTKAVVLAGAAGVGLFYLSQWLDSRPVQLYAAYDYWHTSPNFLLARVGIAMGMLLGGYAWCRWGLGNVGFSPFRQLGQTSLLVYWAHIELVYGRFTILTQRAQSVWKATLGLCVIFLLMLGLSILRTKAKGRRAEIFSWIRRFPETAAGD
jgi:uncharacterized membrane protein